jgi:hypothetical protein
MDKVVPCLIPYNSVFHFKILFNQRLGLEARDTLCDSNLGRPNEFRRSGLNQGFIKIQLSTQDSTVHI